MSIIQTGKISKNDFIFALESLKVKLTSADIGLVFEYLDKNKDGYISYSEFCYLCEEKRRNIDPFEINQKQKNDNASKLSQSFLGTTGDFEEQEQLERMSMASQMYKGFKSNKLKSKLQLSKQNPSNHTFGVTSLPSDNMNKILTHQFEKDYNNHIDKKHDEERERYMIAFNRRALKGGHTKASLIRLEYQ